METKGVGRNYLIILQGLDEMLIQVELDPKVFDGQVKNLEKIEKTIVEGVRNAVQVRPSVELLAPGTLPVSEGKTKRVLDKRSL